MDLLRILDGTPEPPIIDLHLQNLSTSGDYALPTPMYDFQKELTDQIVSLHYPDILKFCETDSTNDSIMQSLQICYENCILVSVHPYLLINHYMPKNLTSKDISSKLAETSGKFNVLKDLVNVVVGRTSVKRDKNVGIVMYNNGKFFDLVEALLLGSKGNKVIRRYVGNSVKKETKSRAAQAAAAAAAAATSTSNGQSLSTTSGTSSNGSTGTTTPAPPSTPSGRGGKSKAGPVNTTNIHLIPHDGQLTRDQSVLDSTKFDFLIIFDSYVDTESEFVRQLRTQQRGDNECVMIRLIPMKTIEHVQFHYGQKPRKSDKAHLYNLISSIVCLRDHIGILPPDLIPIYNQNLNYLSHTFFDNIIKTEEDNRSHKVEFPAWPLPDLPSIPFFNATDVERSLLTEVQYHYTPYDTSENYNSNGGLTANNNNSMSANISTFGSGYSSSATANTKKTYYQSKRIEQNYVTNPLKNDMNVLSGIMPLSGGASIEVALTHKLIMRMNTTYIQWKLIEKEHQEFLKYQDDNDNGNIVFDIGDRIEGLKKCGRRLSDTKKVLSSIIDDVNHAKFRISSAEKRYQKKSDEIEQAKREIISFESTLKNFISEFKIVSPKLITYYENQIKIWSLQAEIQESLDRIISKKEEKSYMQAEYQNAQNSLFEFKTNMIDLKKENEDLKRKVNELEEQQEEVYSEFKKRKSEIVDEIGPEREKGKLLTIKLGKSWKFLKHTSHLKKRKGRGTPPGR
ncbi:HDA1 complex subunit 3 [[Candida] railenensis]|uniref:HDA1 complex subunit 3 n=1 Tax=[Candida] railenensis TaxID=45579 RepID=A0A9P0VZF4_9ASCO|nr:HDA1 complex subunit 3 [[Candida] railenensis]